MSYPPPFYTLVYRSTSPHRLRLLEKDSRHQDCSELFHGGPFWYCTYTLPGQRRKTILVRRVPLGSSMTELEIDGPGRWQRFATWINESLESLPLAERTMDDGWKTIGIVLRFMDLPAELRENVYGQITGASIWPRRRGWSGDSHMKVRVFRYPYEHVLSRGLAFIRTAQEPQSTVLLGVSKKIQAEFKRFTWAGAKLKSFEDAYTFIHLAPHLRLCFGPNAIRRISLDFANDQLFKFLGLSTGPLTGFAPEMQDFKGVYRLKELDTLHHLHFRFQTSPPYWQDGVWNSGDLWHCMRRRQNRDVSCQKISVDWFLTLAFNGLRHIPKLTYSGHIKDSTRQKWDKVFKDERDGKLHDFSREIEDIQTTPWQNLPPVCVCEKACDFWNVHGPHAEGKAPAYQPPPTTTCPETGFHNYDPEVDDRFDCDG
jgi:hypothetical protein